MPRATAPMPWAIASQAAATPRPRNAKKRKTGPGPLRTARGAGRAAVERRRRLAGLRVGFVRRDRVLELPFDEPFAAPREGVLLLRDPGGEDVRVAMLHDPT